MPNPAALAAQPQSAGACAGAGNAATHAAQAVETPLQPAPMGESQPRLSGPPEQGAAAGAAPPPAAVSSAKPGADQAAETQPKPQQAAAKVVAQQRVESCAERVHLPAGKAAAMRAAARPAADTTAMRRQPAAPRQQAGEPGVPLAEAQPAPKQAGTAAVQPAAVAQQTQEPASGPLRLPATMAPRPVEQEQQQQGLAGAAPPPPPSQHQQGAAEAAAASASPAVVPHAATADRPQYPQWGGWWFQMVPHCCEASSTSTFTLATVLLSITTCSTRWRHHLQCRSHRDSRQPRRCCCSVS